MMFFDADVCVCVCYQFTEVEGKSQAIFAVYVSVNGN